MSHNGLQDEDEKIIKMVKGLLQSDSSTEYPSLFITIINYIVNLFRKLFGQESWDDLDFYTIEIWGISDEILDITEEIARTAYGCTTVRAGDRLKIYHLHKRSVILRATEGKVPKWMRSKIRDIDVIVANETGIIEDGDELIEVVVR